MDIVFFTRRVPADEFARNKPAKYVDLVQSARLEDHLVEAYPPIVILTIRVFASTAFSIGFGIVQLIIYAMVVAYR